MCVAARCDYGKSASGSNQKEKTLAKTSKNIASRPRLWLHPDVTQATEKNSRRRMNVLYSGRVQGVGFRYTAKTVAAGFEVAGIIRNLPDGRVELIAEGSRAELDAFRAELQLAGLAGFIRDEQVIWADAKNEFRGFEIVR
jgi:acylphosphatase